MNFGPLIFLGIFFTMSLSWLGLVLGPQLQLGKQTPEPNEKTGQLYPQARSGMAAQGAQIYRANGCFYCHRQQVAPEKFASDIARGWGSRRTVAADYLFDSPVMVGSQRIGPDLANVGLRRPDAQWHFLHLYNPQTTMPAGKKSDMPSYAFLFEERKIGRARSRDALKLPANFAPKPGYEIVPTPAAQQLVAYLKSLHSETPLPEVPSLTPSTNKVETTNAVAATTNAVASGAGIQSATAATNAPAATNNATGTNASQPAATNSPAK
ncbi:MAG: cbb3-type cytochrome c oxidase subunit II [Verrucomicrobiota bacterium]